jgi:hypothetical protein
VKVANTKEGGWCVGAVEGMVMRMTRKERREMWRIVVAMWGRRQPWVLKRKARALRSW